MSRHHIVNGIREDFTQAEEDAQDIIDAAYVSGRFARSVVAVGDKINTKMDNRIKQGVRWALNNGTTIYSIPLTAKMQEFFARNLMKLNESRTSPHKGYVFNGTEKVYMDDTGIRELITFAGEWGDEISRIRLDEIGSLSAMTQAQLDAYDYDNIDWSVDWSVDPQNNGNGWDNDLCKQNL